MDLYRVIADQAEFDAGEILAISKAQYIACVGRVDLIERRDEDPRFMVMATAPLRFGYGEVVGLAAVPERLKSLLAIAETTKTASQPMTAEGRKLDQFLSRSVKTLKRYPPMAGGKFFALIDEMASSERRLDALAEPLLEKMAESERLAGRAVVAKHAKLDAAIDYIKRMDAVSEQLGDGGNDGPKLDTSGASGDSLPRSDGETT